MDGEHFTTGKYHMGYILKECSAPGTDPWLVCTFSAIPSNNSSIRHQYSFQKVLSDIPCHKLFLQDSLGDAGCYYLCARMDFGVADTVCELIEKQRKALGVRKEHVVTVGSSKGATAALYFGLRGHYGHVLAMGPQTRIADFLGRNPRNSTHRNMLRFMTGEESENAYSVLNNVIFDLLQERAGTTLHLLSSENDAEYPIHIVPFLKQLVIDTPENDVEIDNRIGSHAELAKFNPDFVRRKLFALMFNASARWEENGVRVTETNVSRGALKCFFVEEPERVWRFPEHTFFPVSKDGSYTFALVGQSEGSAESFTYIMPQHRVGHATGQSHTLLLEHGIDRVGMSSLIDGLLAGAELSCGTDSITLRILARRQSGLRFAFYLMRDGETLEKTPYSPLAEHTFEHLATGIYSIKFYIRTESNERKSYFVRKITI